MAKQIGSQYRETLAEAGYTFFKRLNNKEVMLKDEDGKLEQWRMNDHFAGHVLEVGGKGYEFCSSM